MWHMLTDSPLPTGESSTTTRPMASFVDEVHEGKKSEAGEKSIMDLQSIILTFTNKAHRTAKNTDMFTTLPHQGKMACSLFKMSTESISSFIILHVLQKSTYRGFRRTWSWYICTLMRPNSECLLKPWIEPVLMQLFVIFRHKTNHTQV